MSDHIDDLFSYLDQSPTPFHAVNTAEKTLLDAGFERLDEGSEWTINRPGKYYVTKNDSSLVAFVLADDPVENGFRMVGAHTDSPCLRIKPNAIASNNGYHKLALEVYGGVLLNPWFDRDLSIAGRVTVLDPKDQIKSWIIDFEKPVAFIPSLAIHLDREVNDHRSINKQLHLPALLCSEGERQLDFSDLLKTQIEAQHDTKINSILSYELSLYDLQKAARVGLNGEFLASARLDNLLSCFAGLKAIVDPDINSNCILVLNDHEEVGSSSTSGAEGPFLMSVLERICGDTSHLRRAISRSMMISADNAHGVHPNYPEKHEPHHQPLLNNGPVIKVNNNQRYATNSETEGVFKTVCEKNGLPYQVMVVRTDMGCGSTIGPITATKLGVRTIDIGAPQLGMHSIRELAGVEDQVTLCSALKGFYKMQDWPF